MTELKLSIHLPINYLTDVANVLVICIFFHNTLTFKVIVFGSLMIDM